MRRRTQFTSPRGKIIAYKLDPGVFVVEFPGTGRNVSLGQPPDAVKRFQQVGYADDNGVTTFVLVDSKVQGDSISWGLIEFPILYALYYIQAEVNGNRVPAFFAGKKPMLVGLRNDVKNAMAVIKYGNYGVEREEDFDAMDVPKATREAIKREILGIAVDHEIKASDSFIDHEILDPAPRDENEFSDIGDGIRIGRIGYNTYRFVYGGEHLDVNVTLLPEESFRSPVEYKHLKFPVMNFGIWHTGEYDGMDPYYSAQHTSLLHKYQPILIDYPANMTEIINHNGLSKQSVNTIIVTHNHDDHVGALVELFRRSERCRIVTTEPVRFSLVRKLAAQINVPEAFFDNSFSWTILPFREDNPYQTETLNLDGVQVTGHLSCHSVPTTIYTFRVNQDGYGYTYGHFLDIVAFRRMEQMVKDGWMPEKHLAHLNRVIRETRYNLVKYDSGCFNDAGLPFTVHGQWQDLIGSATERPFRVFAHAPKNLLDPAYEEEGRFVSMGDVDSTVRAGDGRPVRLGAEKAAITAFFQRSYEAVMDYFRSLVPSPTPEVYALMTHYATAFANCSKQPDPNIGAFLLEQGSEATLVVVIVRGRAQIRQYDKRGVLIRRSTVGDGEVLGDVGVVASLPRIASVKSLNRLAYVTVPASLFLEALGAIGVTYEGHFKEMFQRRIFFQSASVASEDVSTIMLNRIAMAGEMRRVKKGAKLISKGERDRRLLIVSGNVELRAGSRKELIAGPSLIGECEFFLGSDKRPPARLHTATATEAMEVMTLDSALARQVPVLVDNIRRLIRFRRDTIYQDLSRIDPTRL
jgi:CRP-like cAMP-binding protein